MSTHPLALFSPFAREWFETSLGAPTRAQAEAWPAIARGESTLLLAPTGSGKTLAAFLASIDRLMVTPEPPAAARCRVLYVSPLKALAVDVEKNLRAPLTGIAEVARRRDADVRLPTALLRTGDTAAVDRARMVRKPPDILITTPESLFLVLTSKASAMLASVETVIVDEIHALAATKRGAHLFLSLERLETLRHARAPLQRIGLSATQRPLDEIARLLGGFEGRGKGRRPRPVTIVDASEKKSIVVDVRVPAKAMGNAGDAPLSTPRSVWPHLHEEIAKLVKAHRSAMIFVNSRRVAERLAGALNVVAGEEIALAHHGSLAHERRAMLEDRLKRGDLRAIVATSSLELGIDMGAVELVIQVESPPSVASALQRIGRAGHSVGQVSRGVIFPTFRGDLLACAAIVANVRAGVVEETRYPRSPLDVLAQQVVAIAAMGPIGDRELFDLVRRAASFAELTRPVFDGVLDLLSGRFPSDEFAELRPRITWDRDARVITARAGAQRLAVTNAGTIPDRGLYGVFLASAGDAKLPGRAAGKRVGELDEEMVFELREGDVFLLGASSWRADRITHDRVLVSPASGLPGRMPFWHGDRAGRPAAFGARIGEVTRELVSASPVTARRRLREEHGLDATAIETLLRYLSDQVEAAGEAPTDRTLVFERFQDDLGDWRVCLLSPFGSRVHAPWATVVVDSLRASRAGNVEVTWTDDGMAFRLPATDEPPPLEWFLVSPEDIERRAREAVGGTSLFAAHFRECAARALLLPRRRPGLRAPLWAQRKRASDLLGVAAQHPSFPILLETYRECLQDVFDLPALVALLRDIEQRRVRVVTVTTPRASPFAASLLFSFAGSFIYEGDAPLAERRAQALTIDHAQLRELLGEAEVRDLLDPDVVRDHERQLQRLDVPVKHADALHDLLLHLGDLSRPELSARAAPSDVEAWLDELVVAHRVVRVSIAGKERYAAVEDAAKLRDALGVELPRGVPRALLEPRGDAMTELVARFARTHVPFVAGAVASRFGVSVGAVMAAVDPLVARGKVVTGAFLPGATETELSDAGVLRALRQKSLARRRTAVEPVDDEAYARFSVDWQLAPRPGSQALLDAVRQLEGCPIPASVLERDVLPARVRDYHPWELDRLCGSGAVVWAGIDPLGARDGRVALYTAENEAVLARASVVVEGAMAATIRELLSRRGAVFFREIVEAAGGFPERVAMCLWQMVWAGEVTNDTLEPLRGLLHPAKQARGRGRAHGRVVASRSTEGRWSLRGVSWRKLPSDTERSAALAGSFLERYGVVTVEGVRSEGGAGGFGAVYDVFKAMEQAGKVRRGYFVDGHGATQFALPGADDRLRSVREPSPSARAMVMAATDPANPFGASVAWPGTPASGPDDETGRPQRVAGAYVVVRGGSLLAWLGRGGGTLLTFGADRDGRAEALARALGELVETGKRRAILLTRIDRHDAARSPLAASFQRAGFGKSTRGLLRRRSDASFFAKGTRATE